MMGGLRRRLNGLKLKAMLLGRLDACSQLGDAYRTGSLGDESIPIDLAEAVWWYELGARRHDPSSMCVLGTMLLLGDGIEQDRERGRWLLERAAELQHRDALMLLGVILSHGLFGQDVDIVKSIRMQKLARDIPLMSIIVDGYPITRLPNGSLSPETIETALPAGLEAYDPVSRELARPCFRLENSSAPTNTRLGGDPRVPDGFVWPANKGQPMSFIGQLDFSEFPGGADEGLPVGGTLALFYDYDEQPWGFEPEHVSGFSLQYFDAGAKLATQPTPKDTARFDQHHVQPALRWSFPSSSDDSWWPLTKHLDQKRHFRFFDCEERDVDQVLGYAHWVQGDESTQCERVAPDGRQDVDPQWRLLWEISSTNGREFGDVGQLYVMIRRRDLHERRFDRAWVILQCH